MKRNWEIVHDCDAEDGTATCWALQINHPKYGKYVWINADDDYTEFDVEVNRGGFETLITCKSLASAKRWVSRYLL